MANNTTFDNVFRTMLEKMPELIIPVINEISTLSGDIPSWYKKEASQNGTGNAGWENRTISGAGFMCAE